MTNVDHPGDKMTSEDKPPFSARLSTSAFILLCIGSSVLGAAVLLIFTAAISGALQVSDSYNGLFIVASLIVGLFAPVIMLRRKRKKYHRIAQQPSKPEPSPVQPQPDKVETQGSPEPNFVFANERSPATPPFTRPWRHPVLLGVGIGFGVIIGGGIALWLLFAAGSSSDLGLEVRAGFGSLIITNLRNDPTMQVLDIVVNNRNECSTESTSLCQIQGATNPSLIAACSRLSRYDRQQLHTLWVNGGANLFINTFSSSPISLRIGDSHVWTTPCSRVVQVQITTDKGTGTYSFSGQ